MADARVRGYGIAAAVFALDRASKWLIETRVSFTDTFSVIPGFFDIVHSENHGVTFGFLNDAVSRGRTLALVGVTLAAVVGVSVILWKPERLDRLSRWACTLILGGAAGNLFDRAMWGKVTDFLDVYVGEYHWPTFNVADSALVAGSALLILALLRPTHQTPHVS
jgi:signal peptidase II